MLRRLGNSGKILEWGIGPAGSKKDISPFNPHTQNSTAPVSKKRRLRSSISPSEFEGDKTSTQISPQAPQIVGVNFLGGQLSDTPGYIPPDSMGDVGPNQILVCVN